MSVVIIGGQLIHILEVMCEINRAACERILHKTGAYDKGRTFYGKVKKHGRDHFEKIPWTGE